MRLKAENALANEADRSRSTDALQVVVEQVGRMDQLLQNLLRSVQRSEIRRQRVMNIREFLASRASLFREQAGGRQISVNVPDGLAPVEFDTAAVGGALDNLILNAIQNSCDGAPIVLRAEIEDNRLKLSVSDSGTAFLKISASTCSSLSQQAVQMEQDWGWRSSGRSSRPTAGARTLNTETTARRSPWTFQLDRTNERHRADR